MTVSDKKLAIDSDNDGVVNYYNADVVTANDYYPFGSQMPGRKYSQSNSSYRYGFNGQENSDEIAAGLTTAMYWEYDSRIGKRWNVDPEQKIEESPFLCFSGNPILYFDIKGNKSSKPDDWVGKKNEDGTYTPVWKENVTSKSSKNLEKDEIYLFKSGKINATDGNRYVLNSDGTGYKVNKKGEKENIKKASSTVKPKTTIPLKKSPEQKNEIAPNRSRSINDNNPLIPIETENNAIDYVSLNVSAGLFLGKTVGPSLTINLDKNGTLYFSPGISVGKGWLTTVSASLTFNKLDKPNASASDINSFLSGSGYSVGGGYILGAQRSSSGWSPLSGSYSTGIGAYTPQFGATWGYTPDILKFKLW